MSVLVEIEKSVLAKSVLSEFKIGASDCEKIGDKIGVIIQSEIGATDT